MRVGPFDKSLRLALVSAMSEYRPIHRGLALSMAALFTSFVVVQLNDPDSLLWSLAYGLVAMLWCWAAFGRMAHHPVRALGLVYGLVAAWLWPGRIDGFAEEMMSSRPHIEQARESGGLLLACLALLWLARLLRTAPEAAPRHS